MSLWNKLLTWLGIRKKPVPSRFEHLDVSCVQHLVDKGNLEKTLRDAEPQNEQFVGRLKKQEPVVDAFIQKSLDDRRQAKVEPTLLTPSELARKQRDAQQSIGRSVRPKPEPTRIVDYARGQSQSVQHVDTSDDLLLMGTAIAVGMMLSDDTPAAPPTERYEEAYKPAERYEAPEPAYVPPAPVYTPEPTYTPPESTSWNDTSSSRFNDAGSSSWGDSGDSSGGGGGD